MEVGIVSYGGYVPHYRIKASTIARQWGADPISAPRGLNVKEKSVPSLDEDCATISVEASRQALDRSKIDPQEIGAVFVGSESHSYAVKPTGTIVGEALQATPFLFCADLEFACKAGTAGMQFCIALIKAGMIKYGCAIGADTSQGAPGDALEYTASAGGAAFIIGKQDLIAKINDTLSYTTDTPDFWRRDGAFYPQHGGRFTGEPAYFKHVFNASKALLDRLNAKPENYDYAVFHQPNGKFPLKVGKMLGFTRDQIEAGLLTPLIGNTYSGSSPLGLVAVLDVAKPGDRIFLTSYGSGAGADSFDLTVTDGILKMDRKDKLRDAIDKKEYVDYATYAKLRKKIREE
ncbi:MAG TPA: hydroxymethylglutaryl-CoA synthase [Thermoplasmata archaeon]|nr:hydroxymethylglutaryl-CoA synthase [Thermoplasmata archaeon]